MACCDEICESSIVNYSTACDTSLHAAHLRTKKKKSSDSASLRATPDLAT